MSIENGVSNELLACIHELMNQDTLRDFSLGGGTSGYFGLTMPVISVKPCHFERSSKVG